MKTLLILILTINAMTVMASKKINYPPTAREQVTDTYFGTVVSDPYRWLENDTSAATTNWVKLQNAVTYDYLDKIPFRNDLRNRIRELTNYPKLGVPFRKNNDFYFFKNNGLQNQSVLYRTTTDKGKAELILDPNQFSTDGTVALTQIELSNDGNYLAYSISKKGSDWNEIHILDLKTLQKLPDVIRWVKFSNIAWKGNGFYYSAYDVPKDGAIFSRKNEFHKIYYHQLGQEQAENKLIFENKQAPLRNFQASVSDNQEFLFITEIESTTGNTLHIKDLTSENSNIISVVTNFKNDYSVIDYIGNKIYVLTNYNAPNQRLMSFEPSKPSIEHWQTVIPESNAVLQQVTFAGNKMIALYNENASHRVSVFDFQATLQHQIKLPTAGTVSGISGSPKHADIYYAFTSFTYPASIYKFNTQTLVGQLHHQTEVKFNPADYNTEQVFYTSTDGTRVPMFITYKKGMKRNGKNPLMLYGYGGFNISLNPGFNAGRMPFLEKGGIYVVANIRGGGEFGEKWHQAGTKMQKMNVFNDFIAAAEYLIREGYTSKKKIAIHGGSNGGLLVGACMTLRPDLFAVAIPEVGVLDMLRYQKFTIGWAWATDYGTSTESEAMFRYLYAYSPLHNVKKGVKYPATMVMTGDHDDRVVPAHSFKFAATLQHANIGNYVSLIRIDMKAGHGAGKPIAKVIDAQTDMWSFVMHNLKMKY